MRKGIVSAVLSFVVAILAICSSSDALADTADGYVYGVDKAVLEVALRDEKQGFIYRDARLETIFANLQTAFRMAGIPFDKNVPIFANKEGLNEAAGGIIFISEDVLKMDDDTVAFTVGHEMTHIAMNDFRTELVAVLQLASRKQEVVPSEFPLFAAYMRKQRNDGVLPKDFYQGHELRADKVGYMMARAAGYQPDPVKIEKAFVAAGFVTDETYDHPSMVSRMGALSAISVKCQCQCAICQQRRG